MSGSSHGAGTSQSSPWGPQANILKKQIFPEYQRLYKTPFQYYGGDTIAGFTPYQQQAQNAVAARATNGSDLERNAQAQTLATARGDYLDPAKNPYLTATYNQAYNDARPSLNGAAVASGRYGGTGQQIADAQLQARLGTGIYGGNYQTERDRQMQAIAGSPAMANIDYQNLAKLSAVGEEQQNMNQTQINEAMKKFNFDQMEPWQRLGMFDQGIGGNYGGNVIGKNAGGK